MATVQSNQSPYQTDQKKKNELLHNAATPNVLPIQRDPLQPVQMVKQPPNLMPVQPQATIQGQPPVQPMQQPQMPQQQLQQAGTQMAMQGPPTQLQQQYTQKVGELLKDPSMGRDYDDMIQRQLRESDIQRAQATKAAREEVAPFMPSGRVRQDLTDDAIRRAMDRSRLETELRTHYGDKERQDLISALTQAQLATEQQRLGYQTGVGAIAQMIGAGEGAEQRRFTAAENAVNRMHEMSMQTQSIGAQKEIENIRAKLAQGLQANEQDFKRVEAALNRDLQNKLQSGDINARREALQTQLAFDKWKTEAGFELTRSENAANRALELSLQTGDQEFQEKMIRFKEKSAMDMLITSQEFDAVQNDLDRQIQTADIASRFQLLEIKQEFEAIENEQNRQHAESMQLAQFNQEKWLNDRQENLTKLGWSHQEAMQQADHEHTYILAELDRNLQKEIEAGRISLQEKELVQKASQFGDEMEFRRWAAQANLDDAATQRIWQANQNAIQNAFLSSEATLDRQLQKEIESGRLDIQERQLLQQASQFGDEMEFKRWATQTGIDEARADRIWKSSEAALGRAHELQMQQLDREFAEKNINLQAVMSQLEKMDHTQAADIIRDQAIKAGITYVDANGVTQPGIKPIAEEVLKKRQIEDQSIEIMERIQMGQNISPEDYDIIKQSTSINNVPENFEKINLTEWSQDARGSKVGYRAWRFRDDAWEWLNQNKGNVLRDNNGELYKIESFWEPGININDTHKRAFVTLKSLKDGRTIKWQGGDIK